jgi:2-haloacid dehalogenase
MRTKPRILVFDTFGTVVDWYGSIVLEVEQKYPQVDAHAFVGAWREQYHPTMKKVADQVLPWTKLDDLHRLIFNDIAPQFGLAHLSEEEKRDLNLVWHRLKPWPDSIPGLLRLKSHFLIAPLSNGNISLLTHMAKRAELPWDCILSTEIFKAYKPDPRTYLGVLDLFDAQPHEVMMVAAHASDLQAAKACGLQTAFIHRPLEWGLRDAKPTPLHREFDLTCLDLEDLASQLSC